MRPSTVRPRSASHEAIGEQRGETMARTQWASHWCRWGSHWRSRPARAFARHRVALGDRRSESDARLTSGWCNMLGDDASAIAFYQRALPSTSRRTTPITSPPGSTTWLMPTSAGAAASLTAAGGFGQPTHFSQASRLPRALPLARGVRPCRFRRDLPQHLVAGAAPSAISMAAWRRCASSSPFPNRLSATGCVHMSRNHCRRPAAKEQ